MGLLFLGWLTVALVAPVAVDLGDLDPMVAERIEAAREAVASDPENAARWLDLGRLYQAHDLTEPAATCYRETVRLAPDEPRGWYGLAQAEADIGEPEAALASLDRVVALERGYAPAFWRRGRLRLSLGRVEGAERDFERATEVDPTDLAGWVGLAEVRLLRDRPREAIPMLRRVLAADPANGVAGQLLGNALRAIGDEAGARRTLSLATGMGASFPDPWHEEMLDTATGVGNRLRLSGALLERGEVEEALPELEALREAHPRNVGVLNKLSEAYLHMGDAEAALAVLETAYEVDPGEFATLIHIVQAEQLLGRLESALAWSERAVEANPRYWQAHFTRAGLLHRLGRFEDCLAELDAAMDLGAHQNPSAWLMLGDAHLRLEEWAAAGRAFKVATERFPFLGRAFLGLALSRAESGNLAGARSALATALQLQGEDETTASTRARIEELARMKGPQDCGEGAP